MENPQTTGVIPILDLEHEAGAMGSLIYKKCRKRGNDEADVKAPPKVLRKDHASVHPKQSTCGGKSLAAIGLEADFTFTSAAQETPADVSDPEPLSYVKPHTHTQQDIAQVPTTRIPAGAVVTTEAPGLLPVEIPESKRSMLLKKAKAQVARRNERIHVKEEEIKGLGEQVESLKDVETEVYGLRNQTKNLKTLLEAEVDMKKATEEKNVELVMGEERIQAAFEEFKKYEDDRVEKRCAEMDSCLDAMSIDFDEELYTYKLTAIAGHRWVIRHDLRLAVMKCTESIKLR
ncbi:hypothetical protein Tco_0287277 [Tanacetum coccineum]